LRGFFVMVQITLFDGPQWISLFPLTLTRPTCQIRIGCLSIKEKWAMWLQQKIHVHTQKYLRSNFNEEHPRDSGTLLINGSWLPTEVHVDHVKNLRPNQSLWKGTNLLALKVDQYSTDWEYDNIHALADHTTEKVQIPEATIIEFPEDIFLQNGKEIHSDFHLLTKGRKSAPIDPSVSIVGDPSKLFVEEGVSMYHVIMNTTDGPIYIDKNATILEGSMMRGPLYIGESAVVKMGAKLYGETSIGPHCKVGGEIKRSVIQANSNKGHDGYLGDSVIGEWCNFGADTNTSNMKNTYGPINLWDIHKGEKRNTLEQFCGTIMGDHSRCAINTQFNTGTVVGVFANIFGAPPDTYVPSFSWGQQDRYDLDKAIAVAKIVYDRRRQPFTEADESILRHIYNMNP
jgi:UDP-N-acetylglucosamine diphosphorylase/glucosamine-1-phosphate N-acetyltransferase